MLKLFKYHNLIIFFNCFFDICSVQQCIDYYENESDIFYVTEYLPCGNLKNYLEELKAISSDYNINTVYKIVTQLIEGAYTLHKYGIIHRDIKTTNIMIKNNSQKKKSIISTSLGISEVQNIYTDMSDITLKIIDFGLSKTMGKNETADEPYGSLCYKAPELILHKDYNFKVDVWSIGITIYYIAYKILPFDEGTKEDIKNAIINSPIPFYVNNIVFNSYYFKYSVNFDNKNVKDMKSAVIYSILKDCLIKAPEKRYSIEDLYYKYCSHMI